MSMKTRMYTSLVFALLCACFASSKASAALKIQYLQPSIGTDCGINFKRVTSDSDLRLVSERELDSAENTQSSFDLPDTQFATSLCR